MANRKTRYGAMALGLALAAGAALAAGKCWRTEEPTQMVGDSAATDQGWKTLPLVTIGEQDASGNDVNLDKLGYRVPGLLDGIGAVRWDEDTVRVFVNHEFGSTVGYPYELANGTKIPGSRVSYFDIDRSSRKVCGAGLAFERIYDRAGNEVTSATQINEGASTAGFDRFCSSHSFASGEAGFRNDVYFAGEETSNGQECVLDVRRKNLYVAPMLGRLAWENLCAAENFDSDKVVLLIGDDTTGSPLWLYIGERGSEPAGGSYSPPSFLVRNGLGNGCLFVWVSDEGDQDPGDFRGTGSSRKGQFKRIKSFDSSEAGHTGWDSLGFADQGTLRNAAFDGAGAFKFSRPEDVSANPKDGTQIVLNATGNSGFAGGADSWGTTYLVNISKHDLRRQLARKLQDIDGIEAQVSILYDGDDAGGGQFPGPDYGLRSPDNADWADDGTIYLQEDRSVGRFGETSGAEASMWCLNPNNGKLTRILEIDRSAVPTGQNDPSPGDIGNWESSGVLDVTRLFKTRRGETLLIFDVQAHSLKGGGLAQNASQSADLVGGGQLLFASRVSRSGNDRDEDCDDDRNDHRDRD